MDSEQEMQQKSSAVNAEDSASHPPNNKIADNSRAEIDQDENYDDDAIAADLPDFATLSQTEIKEEFIKERKRFDRDLFKSQTMCRKLQVEVKKLQEINTANAKNTNNTSSQFSLPSEFKEKWNELVSEKILDAFPDFLDKYYLLVPLIQELFLLVGELLKQKQDQSIEDIARILNLFDNDVASKKLKKDDKRFQKHNQVMTLLHVKLQSVFQEHNKSIFNFAKKREDGDQKNAQQNNDSDEEDEEIKEIKNIIQTQYKPRVLPLVEETNEGEFVDDFMDNISSDEFVDFFKSIVDLSLHMFLNDPPILMDLTSVTERAKKDEHIQKFDFRLFLKSDYHCIDGFHTDNMPAVIVLPQPLRRGYTYQGIKPAVLVFTEEDFDELFPDEDQKNTVLQDIQRKQEEQEEAKRQKKALKEHDAIKEEEPEKEQETANEKATKLKQQENKQQVQEEKEEEKVDIKPDIQNQDDAGLHERQANTLKEDEVIQIQKKQKSESKREQRASLLSQKKQQSEQSKKKQQNNKNEFDNSKERLTLQIPPDEEIYGLQVDGNENQEEKDMFVNTLDNTDILKTPQHQNDSQLDDSIDDAPPEIERSQQPEVKHMRRSSTEASIRQSLQQVNSKSFLDKANDKLGLAIPSIMSSERIDTKNNKTSDQGTPRKIDMIESARHRRAESSAAQLVASNSKKANDNAENIADIIDNMDNISDSQRQYLRQNSKNEMRAASGTRNLGLSTRDINGSRSGSQNTGSKGYINNTRAELRSQIKQIKMLEETIRQNQSTKNFARKSSNASQENAGVNSFRSTKMGGTSTHNDLEGKLASSFSKNGGAATGQPQLGGLNKPQTQITPVKILSKVPASVLEQRGSRPSPQGRQNKEQQLEYSKVGSGSEGGGGQRKGYSAFSNKAKGFSLVCEDLQKQIITFQNLTKKAQGSLRSNPDERNMKQDTYKQQQSSNNRDNFDPENQHHPELQQPYLDQRFDPEKKSFDLTDNQYSNSMYLNRNATTNQRIGEHLPCDRGETLPVHTISGPSTLEQFEDSHYSWRSAAQHNQKNQLGHYNQQHHQPHPNFNKNDESKFYKNADDTASFIEPNDNASISASANYGHNMNNQSSFSNLGKPPSSSYTKNQESIQAYKSKIQALKDKERNRQRQRSQNRQMANMEQTTNHRRDNAGDMSQDEKQDGRHERSRSKSQTIRNIQKYTQELNKQREQQKGRNAIADEQRSNNSQQRSISPYQRWKMMPRQITQQISKQTSSGSNGNKNQMNTKNPYVNMPMSHASNPNTNDTSMQSNSGITGNPKNRHILQQFQESRGQQQYYGSELSGKDQGMQSQYRPQHQTLSSKYQYSHYIDHEKAQHQTMKPPREPDLHYMGMGSSSSMHEKMMPSHHSQDNHGGQNSSSSMQYLRSSQHQQRIVSGGESIPGTSSVKSSQQLAAGYQSHHHLKQQIKNIKSSGYSGASALSSMTPSSATFNQMHHPLRNNFMDSQRYPIQQQHTPSNGGQLTLTTQTSLSGGLTVGSKTAQEKIYEQQRKLQQRKQIQYEMTQQNRGEQLSNSYHQMGQSEARYGEGRDAAMISNFRSRPKNKYDPGRTHVNDETSSDDNDMNDRHNRRSGVGLSKTFGMNHTDVRSQVASKRASGTGQMHRGVGSHHQGMVGGDDFNDREPKTVKPGHTLIQQQYSRQQNGHGKLHPSEAANERRLRQNFTLEQYKRKMGNTNNN